MTDTSDKRYSNGYRISEKTLKIWNYIIFSIMGIGLAGLAVVIIATAVQYGDAPVEDIPAIYINLMWIFGAVALGIPVILGAIVGGLAIHRFAWIPLLLAMLGMLAEGVATQDGYGYLAPYGWIAIVVGVIGTFLIAIFRTKVDIWLALPILNSPRWYVRRDGKNEIKNGNVATPVFPDDVKKKQDK
jgi:hypothetical protein